VTRRAAGDRRLAVLSLCLLALGGCETSGKSGLRDELARVRAEKGFAVITSTPRRVVFSARGQPIVVEPPDGYCLDEGAVEVSSRAAFALVADCLEDLQPRLASADATERIIEIDLPRSFPGVMTVSITGNSAFGKGEGENGFRKFEAALNSAAGQKMLGRGERSAPGKVITTRRIGGAFYVLIEEPIEGGIFAPRFWRAFLHVNDRLVLVSVSGFVDRPISEEAMMGFLARQMVSLRSANGMDPVAEEDEIAKSMEETLDLRSGRDTLTVVRSDKPVKTSDGTDPVVAPFPPLRGVPSLPGSGDAVPMPPPKVVLAQALARGAAAAEAPARAAPPAGSLGISGVPLPPRRPGIGTGTPVATAAAVPPGKPTRNPPSGSRLAPAEAPTAPHRPG